ncbi:MAG: CPBP family intramembrane glutamic endopeptidase [Actinomycetota bacterium]
MQAKENTESGKGGADTSSQEEVFADNVRSQSPPRGKGVIARYPLIFYFVIAYAGSWLVVLPYLRSAGGAGLLPFNWPIPFPVSAALAPFAGPCLAAFIMTGVTQGSAGIRRLLRRIVLWRVGVWWYLFALVGIPAITVLGALVLPGVLASWQAPASSLLLTYPFSFVVSLIIGGPLGEEIGWRGFALPRLQRTQGPLVGSLILGLLWAFWHLPYFWMPEWGTPKDTALDIVWFVLADIALTIVYTWVFNNTKGSLLIVILVHASNDAFFINQLFRAPIVADSLLPFVVGFGAVAVLLIILTRGRLDYDRHRQDIESNVWGKKGVPA